MRQFLSLASSSLRFLLLAPAFTLALSACQGLKTRGDINGKRPSDVHGADGKVLSPLPTPPPPPATATPEPGADGADALPRPTPPPSVAGPDTFLSKELPKIGVILGPGGLKAFAHVGVLREFARARVPIHAITGMEWGSLMAAFYAEKGLANDVDWKAFRMKDSDLSTGGVLRSGRVRSMGDFDSYLSIALASGALDKDKVPFGCPTIVKRDRLQFLSKGITKDVVSRCLPYPPLLGPYGDNIAAVDAIEESAHWLRSQGANLIILVNVLGAGEPLSNGKSDDQYGTSVLWTEVRRKLMKVRAPVVNWIVSVNTVGKHIDDLGSRRANVELGAKAAMDLTTKLTKQYGF
jgi:NTE family protein